MIYSSIYNTVRNCKSQPKKTLKRITDDSCIMSSMSIMQERIRTRRKELGFTQEEVAKRLGIETSSYQAWEDAERPKRGKKLVSPKISRIPALCQILECDPNWLQFGNTFENTRPPSLKKQYKTPYYLWSAVHLIDYDTATGIFTNKTTEQHLVGYMIYPGRNYKPELYSLEVEGDSMDDGTDNGYKHGEFIWIDPTIEAKHNDDVVIVTAENHILFRNLKLTSEGTYISLLNKTYPNHTTTMPPNAKIKGVVDCSNQIKIRRKS